MKVNKMKQPNDSITCRVDACCYYMPGDRCGAEKIEVRYKNQAKSQDTDCATFCKE